MRISTPPADSEKIACPRCGSISQLHTGVCVSCLLSEGLESGDEVSRAVFESAIAEVNVPDKQWRLGDYEILDEIGRGGMGVIYLARQRHPQRIVAVKRVLDYHADSHETLKRFRREADAVASLDHPNILPIYEVSESEDGLPFFSMKFATGGSLRMIAPALRTDPRQCVQLIAKVARAVQYAHTQGILHRDLKPGNILLDGRGEPMVSDFGLAKWLDANRDITKSLTAFGTPGYTAPEQAEGKTADLTPAADVYSIGAILFELLTGRPPFVGDNALLVVRQASETSAPKLRSLTHSHDRDLETICARCLERDPRARYQSAGDLATDLERWLDGRPIVARPISVPTRLGRWSRRNPKLIATATACLLFGAATMWFFRDERARMRPAPPGKSIAVLPFDNLSGDPDNAYFADGIQEEILTRLASIAELKVISRTSTQRYQNKPRNLGEIAKQLGVANIVEGSVQKAADQVRVSVQLINAQTDSHLWADAYDRKLTDILMVESEIAKRIAESLQAKLTGSEQQALAIKPTDNVEAYDAYLRGLAYTLKTDSPANLLGAQKHLKEAVRLDPKFALAWALLSYVDARGYLTGTLQRTVGLREEARQAAETALTLQPNLGEAVLALGYSYACLEDYDTALRYYEQARQLLPNSSRTSESLAYSTRRRGLWERSESFFNEAERLDPRNGFLLEQHAFSYVALRRFRDALRKLDQVLNITPDDVFTLALKAAIAQGEGDLPRASALLAPLHPNADDSSTLETQVYQAILERRPEQIIPRLKEILAKPDPALGSINGELRFWLGWAQEVAGDHAAARKTWQQARSELESFLKDRPENCIWDLALTNMGLGDKAAAFALAERAAIMIPIEKDALGGPGGTEILARVAARMGEPDRAIAALQKLLSIPYYGAVSWNVPLTPALLRLDPMFDPLRNDPRFQELCKDKTDKSIAVLPFENLSRDPDNAYFAEGIQEEILTRLAGIADLKVISRTSTQRYQSKPRDLGDIAKQLGVANIVEGSVQKAAGQVRVNVQLINAQSDSHLWAETYDRKLTDIFGVETEIAKGIVESLQAKLSHREEQVIAAKPTDNPDAYDAYLRGVVYSLRGGNTPANLVSAQKYLREAVRLDPKFALGWALLSYVDAIGYVSTSLQPTLALREEARLAADTALTLKPNLGEAVWAKGFYHYACLRDYDNAVRYFEQARPFLPNSSQIPESLAMVMRRRGQYDRSESYFNEAERLDPRNPRMLNQHAGGYMHLRCFPEALRKLDQVLNITPDDVDILVEKASIAQVQGDLPRAAALLAPLRLTDVTDLEIQVYQRILERRPASIIPRLKELLAKPDPALGYYNGRLRFWLGWAQEVAGDQAADRETWQQARSELESFLKEQPENWSLIGYLALTRTGLGDKAAALALAERAIAANPIEKDALWGTQSVEILARVAAQLGEPERAIAALQKLLSIPASGSLNAPAPITPALLRLDPMFDPLRGDPRFQELCKDKQQL